MLRSFQVGERTHLNAILDFSPEWRLFLRQGARKEHSFKNMTDVMFLNVDGRPEVRSTEGAEPRRPPHMFQRTDGVKLHIFDTYC